MAQPQDGLVFRGEDLDMNSVVSSYRRASDQNLTLGRMFPASARDCGRGWCHFSGRGAVSVRSGTDVNDAYSSAELTRKCRQRLVRHAAARGKRDCGCFHGDWLRERISEKSRRSRKNDGPRSLPLAAGVAVMIISSSAWWRCNAPTPHRISCSQPAWNRSSCL